MEHVSASFYLDVTRPSALQHSPDADASRAPGSLETHRSVQGPPSLPVQPKKGQAVIRNAHTREKSFGLRVETLRLRRASVTAARTSLFWKV